MKISISSFFSFLVLVSHLYSSDYLSEKISQLRERTKEHKNYIGSLLDDGFSEFESRSSPLPVNDFEDTRSNESDADIKYFEERVVESAVLERQRNEPVVTSETAEFPNQYNTNLSESYQNGYSTSYEELYSTGIAERRLGNYFGPFLGFALPDDPKVNGSSYQSDMGFVMGLRLGRDFGAIRAEGEYAYLSYDLDGGGDASLHNFFSRFILEKELADLADFRAGIGLGLTSLEVLSESEVSFAYDFLLGWSYRFSNHWSMSFDYRYFLTAASESFGRSQGHILEVSANFDL